MTVLARWRSRLKRRLFLRLAADAEILDALIAEHVAHKHDNPELMALQIISALDPPRNHEAYLALLWASQSCPSCRVDVADRGWRIAALMLTDEWREAHKLRQFELLDAEQAGHI
jgi:hypothetical protein